eukprot:s97_g27.t4
MEKSRKAPTLSFIGHQEEVYIPQAETPIGLSGFATCCKFGSCSLYDAKVVDTDAMPFQFPAAGFLEETLAGMFGAPQSSSPPSKNWNRLQAATNTEACQASCRSLAWVALGHVFQSMAPECFPEMRHSQLFNKVPGHIFLRALPQCRLALRAVSRNSVEIIAGPWRPALGVQKTEDGSLLVRQSSPSVYNQSLHGHFVFMLSGLERVSAGWYRLRAIRHPAAWHKPAEPVMQVSESITASLKLKVPKLQELLAQIQRAPKGTQTCLVAAKVDASIALPRPLVHQAISIVVSISVVICGVLIDGPQYASNVGSAAVLQSPSDVLAAVLLASSKSSPQSAISASFPSEKFLKNVVRISLADRPANQTRGVTTFRITSNFQGTGTIIAELVRQALRRGAARLVVSPGDPRPALRELQRAGYHLVGLENLEACSIPSSALWSSPLSHSKLCFVAGGEAQSLSPEILDMCDQQCHIPALNFDMAGTKSERLQLGQESHTPSLNLAHAVVIALYERRRQLSLEESFTPSS